VEVSPGVGVMHVYRCGADLKFDEMKGNKIFFWVPIKTLVVVFSIVEVWRWRRAAAGVGAMHVYRCGADLKFDGVNLQSESFV
jgi:hypothetical protein